MSKNPLELTVSEIPIGLVQTDYQSALKNHTGSWRSERPIWDETRCIKCGVCSLFCPEFCIKVDDQGYFHANLDYCKGCGVCYKECWTQCITLKQEEA
jgi:pyruvate ferredoxin oxidoreductase delta subunit